MVLLSLLWFYNSCYTRVFFPFFAFYLFDETTYSLFSIICWRRFTSAPMQDETLLAQEQTTVQLVVSTGDEHGRAKLIEASLIRTLAKWSLQNAEAVRQGKQFGLKTKHIFLRPTASPQDLSSTQKCAMQKVILHLSFNLLLSRLILCIPPGITEEWEPPRVVFRVSSQQSNKR